MSLGLDNINDSKKIEKYLSDNPNTSEDTETMFHSALGTSENPRKKKKKRSSDYEYTDESSAEGNLSGASFFWIKTV